VNSRPAVLTSRYLSWVIVPLGLLATEWLYFGLIFAPSDDPNQLFADDDRQILEVHVYQVLILAVVATCLVLTLARRRRWRRVAALLAVALSVPPILFAVWATI
jgi:hypothetical protein